jgi:hypothetical protein
VTTPAADTETVVGLSVDQATCRPLSSVFAASRSETLSCAVMPTLIVVDSGVMMTSATSVGEAESWQAAAIARMAATAAHEVLRRIEFT